MNLLFLTAYFIGCAVLFSLYLLFLHWLGRNLACLFFCDVAETFAHIKAAVWWIHCRFSELHVWAWEKASAANLSDVNTRKAGL